MSAVRSSSFAIPQSLQKSPDPILGVAARFEKDQRRKKLDVGIGVIKNENGQIFTPSVIQRARKHLAMDAVAYLSPAGEEEYLGDRTFLQETARIVFGTFAEDLFSQRKLASIGTVGGTGAFATFTDMVSYTNPESPFLISLPTWPNHLQIAQSRKRQVITYQHLQNNTFDLSLHLQAIKKSPPDTIVIFQTGKTHNPTGSNPDTHEWEEIADAMERRRAFFDTPYAGFGKDLTADTEAIRIFLKRGIPLAVGVSFAKNGGLYNLRPGALLIPFTTSHDALSMQRVLNAIARTNYSSPPATGERIIAHILSDKDLSASWHAELLDAAEMLQNRREIFTHILSPFSFVTEQAGLYSLLTLSSVQIERLQKEFAIYMPQSGRVNFGGISSSQIPYFAKAVQAVL